MSDNLASTKLATILNGRDNPRKIYKRPQKGWLAWFNRFLGSTPTNAQVLTPDEEVQKHLPNYRFGAAITAIVMFGLIFGVASLAPDIFISPASLISDGMRLIGDNVWITVISTLLIVALFVAVGKVTHFGDYPERGKLLDRFAMGEEQHFRMGAENWTTRQRIQSCAVFGMIHIQNIIYPITSLIAVGLVGGILMGIYLSHHRKTGDHRQATLASAKFHATYNRFVLLMLAIYLVVAIYFV